MCKWAWTWEHYPPTRAVKSCKSDICICPLACLRVAHDALYNFLDPQFPMSTVCTDLLPPPAPPLLIQCGAEPLDTFKGRPLLDHLMYVHSWGARLTSSFPSNIYQFIASKFCFEGCGGAVRLETGNFCVRVCIQCFCYTSWSS